MSANTLRPTFSLLSSDDVDNNRLHYLQYLPLFGMRLSTPVFETVIIPCFDTIQLLLIKRLYNCYPHNNTVHRVREYFDCL